MYGLYRLVRELREQLNDKSDRIWSWEKKVRAIQTGVAALSEQGIYEARTHLGISTAGSTFLYALPGDVDPDLVFQVYMPTTSSADPVAPIVNWRVEARGATNFLALYRAYPESRALRVEYLAPYQVYPTLSTLSGSLTAVATGIGVDCASDWPASGYAEIWPLTETHIGEVVYYDSRTSTNLATVIRAVEGRPSQFAPPTSIGPALNMAAEIKELVLLVAQAECWAMRQSMSSRSQYLQNYANLEIKLRRQFNDRVPKARNRTPVKIQSNKWPYYGSSTSPSTVKDYFERG